MAAARQLILDLLARDKTGPGTKSAAANIDDVAVSADAAAKATDKLGNKSDVAEGQVQRLGKSARTASEHVAVLDHEIKTCERELQKLAVAFAEAKTAADRADLSKGIRNTERELTKLKKNRNVLKELEPSGPEVKQFENSISGAFENIKLGPALGAVLVAASPVIGATISAAVIGAAGVGGVIGGVMLAAKDARVKGAGAELGKNLLGELEKDAAVFVGPVLKAVNEVEIAFAGLNGRIKNIFGASSGFLDPLVQGVLGGVSGVVKGIESLVTKGKPVMDALGKTFTTVGSAVGDALSMIAGDSGDAADALNHIASAIGFTIKAAGFLVRALTEVYGFITFLPRHVEAWEKSLFGMNDAQKASTASASVLATVMGTVGKLVLSSGEAAGAAGQQMQTFADKMDDAAAKGRSLYDSQTSVAQAMADARKAAEENGKTLDLNTQKGRDNRKALSSVAQELVANYDAYVKVNGEGAAAQGVAERNRAAFVRLAGQFGVSKAKAQALATELGLIPADKKTNFYANTHDAAARIAALKGAIGGVHGKTVTVNVSVTGLERLNAAGHRIGGYRAAGGPVMAGKAYVVGEHRPEVFVPSTNGTIIPSISQARSSGWGGGGGAGTVVLENRGVIGSQMQLESWLEKSIDNLRRKGKL